MGSGSGPRVLLSPGASGCGTWTRSPTPLGGEALPLMMEVYGWLNWASSGITRG